MDFNLVGNLQLSNKEVTEREPVGVSEQGKILKDVSVQVSPSSSTEKTRLPSIQSINPKPSLPSVQLLSNSKKTISTRKVSKLRRPCMVNVMELEIPSAKETDGNAEKAEAYTKALKGDNSFSGKGTTIVALIGRDAIYIGSDSLVVSGHQDDLDQPSYYQPHMP
ncbi:uncharacterized protein LOC133718952 isoform X2 [Rosa rugosa]|uniref:uncharacterized protein LOC133718952 isoform X2 n=1 Tax=Rosa rugosa TaxID=74645 RepID=UPI002B40D634|nr:uncharacterized protein LOC133718952 isoform X2 [Rosa rugosa]